MERVTEFMEERPHFVECEKRRLGLRGLGKIAHDGNVRPTDLSAPETLLTQRSHPGPPFFGRAGKEIRVEKTHRLARSLIRHFVGSNIRMVNRNVRARLELQTVQALCMQK